jgi:cytochrome c oxidase subunit 1
MKYGKDAGTNPWRATGLEWKTPSPPPTHNFDVTPTVDYRPYDYEAMKEELHLV